MDKEELARIVEMGLLCSPGPCTVRKMTSLFDKKDKVSGKQIEEAIERLVASWKDKAVEIVKTASGWQVRSKVAYKEHLQRFLEASPPRLSRPLLEVLTIVAYHQPATRGEIEEIRGVTTSANQLDTLEELSWVEVLGKKEVPGRPLLYGTTAQFLDDLSLRDISELPALEGFSEVFQDGSLGEDVATTEQGKNSSTLSPQTEQDRSNV